MATTSTPVGTLQLITLLVLLASAALTFLPSTESLGAFLSADFGLAMVPSYTVLFTPLIWRPSVILRRAGMRVLAIVTAGVIVASLRTDSVVDVATSENWSRYVMFRAMFPSAN